MTCANTASAFPIAIEIGRTAPRMALRPHARIMLTCGAINLLLIALAISIGWREEGRIDALFQEGRLVTYVSATQIVAVAAMSMAMFAVRRSAAAGSVWLWPLMAAGLAFLAADEAFALHERMDQGLHAYFGWKEDAITDRLDDVIILACGLIGLLSVWFFRTELRPFRFVRPLLVMAFSLFFAMVAVDLLSNRWNLDESRLPSAEIIAALTASATVVEESLKLFSEAAFVAAFASMAMMAWRQLRIDQAVTGA